MTGHPSDERLERFVTQRLPSREVVAIARHLDDCPACALRARALDPLAPAFASVDDPPPPEGLERAILERASQPAAPVVPPWGMALALLAMAAGLLVALGDPAGLFATAGRAASSLVRTGGTLTGLLPSPPLVLAAGAAVGLASSLAAFGLLRPSREAP